METNKKTYDLEDRTFEFAKAVRLFVARLPKNISSIEDGKQVIRSSGSMAANYIEANEALSKKDFVMRIKICRKESKETILWLKLVCSMDGALDADRLKLIQEACELMKIFAAILHKTE